MVTYSACHILADFTNREATEGIGHSVICLKHILQDTSRERTLCKRVRSLTQCHVRADMIVPVCSEVGLQPCTKHKNTCTHTVYTHTHIHTHVRTHTHIHVCAHTRAHTHVRTKAHTHTHTHKHTHMHTQTDWSLSSVRLQVAGIAGSSSADSSADSSSSSNDPLSLPMASLEGKPGIKGRLWGSYLPIATLAPEQLQQGMAPPGISSGCTAFVCVEIGRAHV